jgi:uncharacterized NAD(P)/FAD-binding protein YdhS
MSKVDLSRFKEVVGQLKTKQKQLKGLMNKETLREAKHYAESSSQELKKLIQSTDVKKVRSFIEKEAKEIQKLQKQIPNELVKFSKFVDSQRKEFEKVLKSVNALEAAEFIGKKVGLTKKPVRKRASPKKAEASTGSSSATSQKGGSTGSSKDSNE